MIKLSILVREDGDIISEFDSYIKPVPPLSKAEKEILTFDYASLRNATPLCDLTFSIIELLGNTQTVFLDRFSESIFKKAFKEIGYPIGAATFILEKIFKKTFKRKHNFDLIIALKTFEIDQEISNNLDRCMAMEKIFSKLEELGTANHPKSSSENGNCRSTHQIDWSNLPKNPGVYLFRDHTGTIIYVGKAKNISKRVRDHFISTSIFEQELCGHTAMVDFEETGSETIALLLESYYITQLKPTYNTQQKKIIDPFIITSKMDSKGILRIQPIQKSYTDSENEFYYNRDSVLKKIIEVQQKFNLCKRFSGIERTASKCSDIVFCQGICEDLESKEDYNERVKNALSYIFRERPSYLIRLKGRTPFESGFILVKNGIYHGFGFIESEFQINSIADIESFTKYFPHTYFTSRIIDQHFKNHLRNSENIIPI